jgi:Squalene-hopene cyclase C-terminal domain
MWLDNFRYDPLAPLIKCKAQSVSISAQHDLMDKVISLENLWQLPEPQKILRKQRKNGSWEYSGAKEHIRSKENYNQLETYRNMGRLVEEFRFTKKHSAIQKASEYLFTFQTKEGDFRGIYGNQYTPNYSAGIAELLTKAGYERDKRIKKVIEWLISIRQSDGGWAIPLRTRNCNLGIISSNTKPIQPDLSKPSSYLITGVVLRAFAAHPLSRKSREAIDAGWFLLSGLFRKDNYPDRAGKEYWLRFTFPFWFTDLISSMDTLSRLVFSKEEPEIKKALHWFTSQQRKNGLWELRITKGQNKEIIQAWLSLAICRIFKRLDENEIAAARAFRR